MNRRIVAFCALAVALAVLFVRLGIWQLDRLGERRAQNADTRARLSQPTTSFARLRREKAGWLRQTALEGVPDYANEFVVTGRSRNGSPGVHIFTPVMIPGNDTVVLVNRGWVYSPDAATVELGRWREKRVAFHGYTQQLPWPHTAPPIKGRGLRTLGFMGVDLLLPYRFYGLYLVSQDSAADSTPARLPMPALDDGPHLSYAIQWFSFAAIALIGAAMITIRARRQELD